MGKGDPNAMSDAAFRLMAFTMALQDRLLPRIDGRIGAFPIRPGMTVADYGCGPGRYTTRFARAVGNAGRVYAVDVKELALEYVRRRARCGGLSNVVPVLASGYKAGIPGHTVDIVFALDMIHSVKEPLALLKELFRICKREGVLIIDDGHQPRERTVRAISESGLWRIAEESDDHLKCKPIGRPAS